MARLRYGCLSPWERDPALYGRAALVRRFAMCEADVLSTLSDLLRKRLDYEERDGEGFLDAVQNARIVANAERYYRVMYYGSAESWNLRDRHMFDTLQSLLAFRGTSADTAKAVVWEHNSHIGNAAATELLSHYFQAVLPWQLDEYCWFDETRAVTPLAPEAHAGMPETYPFGL